MMNVLAVFLLFVQLAYVCQAEPITLKLVGGSGAHEGNVLVKRGSDWGVVCDDDWDVAAGNVVCRQLGYQKALTVTTYNKFHSSLSERIFLDDVKCQGYENNLGECKHREWFASNCNAGEAAGVVCSLEGSGSDSVWQIVASTELPQPAVPQLEAHPTPSMRIDIEKNGNLITQYSEEETHYQPEPVTTTEGTEATEIAEEEVGYGGYSQRTRELLERVRSLLNHPGLAPQPSTHQQPSPPISSVDDSSILANRIASLTRDELDMDSSSDEDIEWSSATLPARSGSAALEGRSGSFEARENQPASIQPREVTSDEQNKIRKLMDDINSKSDQPMKPAAKPIHIEILGGRLKSEGYVQVTMDDGRRGVICSDNWGIYEAMVACRQTGKHQAQKATRMDYYGASSQDKVIYELNCDGHERSLADCEYKLSDRHGVKCSAPMNVAGVVCTSAKLPDLMPNINALMYSIRIEDKPLHALTCSMEEKCLSSSAYNMNPVAASSFGGYSSGYFGGFNAGPTRRLLRFSSNIYNNGTADFRPKHHRSTWEWHSCHQHYHSMGAFSHYDILDSHGNRVAEGHKASFCLEDVECDYGKYKKYSCRGHADQGISVGCADVYKFDIDCQWIDITDLQPGAYMFKLNVNPDLEVAELNFDNNAAMCELDYNGYSAKLSKCVLRRG